MVIHFLLLLSDFNSVFSAVGEFMLFLFDLHALCRIKNRANPPRFW